jgi:DNA polymerase elongation subunit (family B)
MALQIFPYSWYIDEEETQETYIRIYGLTPENENICIRINNFTPYVYLELPETNISDIPIIWNTTNSQQVCTKLDELLGEHKPISKVLQFKKRLYYADIDSNKNRKLFPFLFLQFSSQASIKQLCYKTKRDMNILGVGKIKLKVHEQDASPILQLTCIRDIPTAGWIDFTGKKIKQEDKLTTCQHEYIVPWKNLSKNIEKNDMVARPLIMGFDIEVNSTNPSAMPKAEKIGDVVFQISCVLGRQGDSDDKWKSYLLTLGDPDQNIVGDDVEIRRFDTEAELLLGYTKFIQEFNPNIIVGYNILGFDIPYMIARAKRSLVIYEFDKQGFYKDAHAKEKTIKWSSSAYKNQEFQFLDAEGRLYVDLLPLVKRDYKMDNYKLKTITTFFLGKENTKDPLDAKGIFKCYRIGMKGGEQGRKAMALVGKYCVKDSIITIKLMEKLQTWVGLTEMARVCNTNIFSLYTAGQQIKVYSQVYKKCMHDNFVVEKDGYVTAENEHYTGAHVFEPITGVHDNVVPFDFASLYPSTIIAYNIDYSTLVRDDSISNRLCHVISWGDHVYCEHDPKVIEKDRLTKIINVIENDIKVLRNKRDKSMSKIRKLEIKEEIDKKTLEKKPFVKQRSEIFKIKPKHIMCVERKYRFLKEPKGVMPTILQNLLDARANTRKQMKEYSKKLASLQGSEKTDLETLINVLDKRQLAYKISSNSMYGAMGVVRGYLPFMPGAMATTAMGRKNIEIAAKAIQEKHQGRLIYGDTDSNYVMFPHLDGKPASELWDYCEHVAKEVSNLFPDAINLAYEEVIYKRFLILTKKRYMYLSCDRNGVVSNKVGKKGVLLARRDNSQFIRTLYGDIIMKLFNKYDKDQLLYDLIQDMNKLCGAAYPSKDFVVTKAVGAIEDYKIKTLPDDPEKRQKRLDDLNCTEAEYATKCLPAQVQLAEKMRSRGMRVDPGSRLEYVITVGGGHKAKQSEKVEDIDYYKNYAESGILRLDYMYYLKLLSIPLDQVFRVVYGMNDFVLNQYKYRIKIMKVHEELLNLFRPKIQMSEINFVIEE